MYGSQWDVEELVISDLIIDQNDANEEKISAIKARQRCLRAAGYDPGPIDGIQGSRTDAAAAEFAKDRGNIRVDWNSKVFLRHLVQFTIERHRNQAVRIN